MEENYIIGLVVAFLFGFVLFKKDKSAPALEFKKEVKSYRDSSGVTGVAKYLQEKEALIAEQTQKPVVSGVAKYLANREETPVSGVSKYMARQAVHAKKMAKENVSGVEKYLNSRG